MLHKSRTTATAAILIAALAAPPAHAWGKKEQNLLKGLAAAAIVGTIIYQSRNNQPARAYSAQPRYQAAPVTRTYQEPTRYTPAPTSTVYSTPAARAFNSYGPSDRRLIQSRMANAGYYQGGIDGAFGPMTHRAVTALAGDTVGTSHITTMAGAQDFYDRLIR